MKTKIFFVLFLLLFVGLIHANEGDKVFCDFESENYGDWQVEGQAFGPGPAVGGFANQMQVSGFLGKRLVNTYFGGDGSKGKLTSPEFKIEMPFISFLLGGGGHPGTHIDLLVDGKAVRTARGPNVKDGGSEVLEWFSWSVADLMGKTARIQLVDEETGGWGHINIDQIVFSRQKYMRGPFSGEIKFEKKYLHLPVKTGAPKTWMKIEVEGKVVREFIIELAENSNDISFHAMLDISEWKDKTAFVLIEKYKPGKEGMNILTQSDQYPDLDTAYKEKYRPQFHFAPRRGWTNDPNGLLFYKGEYHLFYQHNPFGTTWNNMTWGHAVSRDLFHWQEFPDAIHPDRLGSIFSGSGVVDHNNSSGVGTGVESPLFGIFTYNGSSMRYGEPTSQGIAYSNDRGRTWTKYEKNPVLPHIIGGNRDPKVFWYAPTKCWIMALYLDKQDYALFESPNLKEWKKICDIKNLGCSECPDMFELAVDGNELNKKWVFWGGNGIYLIGTFDGKMFTKESEPLLMKWGGNDYAAQSYSDTPGRRIQFSWMNGGVYPDMPFNQQFSVPRELTLRNTTDGIRLCTNPAKELESLRGKMIGKNKIALKNSMKIDLPSTELLDLEMTINVGTSEKIVLTLHGQTITLLLKEKAFMVNDVRAPLTVQNGRVELRIVLDRMSIEVFVNRGLSQIAKCFIPVEGQAYGSIQVESNGLGASIESLRVWPLQRVWK